MWHSSVASDGWSRDCQAVCQRKGPRNSAETLLGGAIVGGSLSETYHFVGLRGRELFLGQRPTSKTASMARKRPSQRGRSP